MRNPLAKDADRIDEILKLISEIWHKNPDLRLCQLISNCFSENDLYYIEDIELQDKLDDCVSSGRLFIRRKE